MQLTPRQVKNILNTDITYAMWCDLFNKILPENNIDTRVRVAAFLAQTCHESNYYQVYEENLNYSAKALQSIWGARFKRAGKNPKDYHRKPVAIGNFVYADRMDNGPEESGDGYAFRGKGAIQITGKYNHTEFGKTVNKTPWETIDYLLTSEGSLMGAVWYWNSNNLNKYADKGDLKTLCRRINGGYIGLDDRNHKYKKILGILDGKIDHYVPRLCLKLGSRGPDVEKVQKALGLDEDGRFGKMTQAAVMDWQSKNGLFSDGIVGPKTMAKLCP